MRSNRFLRWLAPGIAIFGGTWLWAASPPPFLVLQAGPVESLTSVAVSPDGSLIATNSFDGAVRIHDARTGALVRAIGADVEPGGRTVAFAPDGRSLAVAGFHMDKQVRLWDPRTGALVRALAGHTEIETYAVAFSPDGRLLASAGKDRQILVWDLKAGTLRHRITDQALPVTALAFSSDSRTLASGGGERSVSLWDATSGRRVRSLTGHRDWVTTLAFSGDGRSLASGSSDWAYHRGRDPSRFGAPDPDSESEWRLWDVATGDLKRAVTAPGRLLSLAFAPGSASLACGIGKEVRLYDLRSENSGRVVASHEAPTTAVAFSPEGGSIISTGHDRTVQRVSLSTGAVAWRVPGSWEQVNSVALSPDRSLIATGSGDLRFAERLLRADASGLCPGMVRLWDARTGRFVRRLGDPTEQVMAVAFSPDGRRVACGGGSGSGSGVVRVWDTGTGAALWSQADHAAEVLAIAFAPDGSSLASAGADGLIRLHDPDTGAARRTLGGHEGGATSIAFSTDGALLVCGAGDGSASLWDVPTGRRLRTMRPAGAPARGATDGDRLITSVALGPDGGTLAMCRASMGPTYDDRVRFWDTRTGEQKREFADPVVQGRPIALSPDGTILATGNKTIKLWDVRTGKLLRELFGHLKKTQSIAFSADGRLLVSGGNYATTNAWEVATGRHLVTLFTFSESRPGTLSEEWLAYTPDGFYDGSSGVDRFLAWRIGAEFRTPDTFSPPRRHPDRVASALQLASP